MVPAYCKKHIRSCNTYRISTNLKPWPSLGRDRLSPPARWCRVLLLCSRSPSVPPFALLITDASALMVADRRPFIFVFSHPSLTPTETLSFSSTGEFRKPVNLGLSRSLSCTPEDRCTLKLLGRPSGWSQKPHNKTVPIKHTTHPPFASTLKNHITSRCPSNARQVIRNHRLQPTTTEIPDISED